MSATSYFTDHNDFITHLREKNRHGFSIAHRELSDYPGMVLEILIRFDLTIPFYHLNLQWISFGLDAYAENLLEEYVYAFESPRQLLDYLQTHYGTHVTHIAKDYRIDHDRFPNPLKDNSREAEYTEAWERFKRDFKAGRFLDNDALLYFSSLERGEWQ